MAKRGLHGAVGGRSEQAVGARAGWGRRRGCVRKCRSEEQILLAARGEDGTGVVSEAFQLTSFRGSARHTVLSRLGNSNVVSTLFL